jgi:phage gpG-like protein
MSSIPSILEGAKQALKNADNFGQRETGNKKAGSPPSYAAAHEARKAEGSATAHAAAPAKEFMGVRSDEAPELNTALKARGDAQKALNE